MKRHLRVTALILAVIASTGAIGTAWYLSNHPETQPAGHDDDNPAATVHTKDRSSASRYETGSLNGGEPMEATNNSTERNDGSEPVSKEYLVRFLRSNPQSNYKKLAEGTPDIFLGAASEILNDSNYSERWNDVLMFLFALGRSDESSDLLMDFATRDEAQWIATQSIIREITFRQKVIALRIIGRTGGERAFQFLRDAITEEEAKRVAAEWLDEVERGAIDSTPTRYLQDVRANAAKGLSFSNDSENLAALDREYQALHIEIQNRVGAKLAPGESRRHMTDAERDFEILYGGFVSAKINAAVIADLGMERSIYELQHNEAQAEISLQGRYEEKNLFPYYSYHLPEPPIEYQS